MFKYFGAPANKQAFESLARSFSIKQLLQQNLSIVQIESFLFGIAGLLLGQDDYAKKLENEYRFSEKKMKLKSLNTSQWKFARVRPQNFPTIRIAQLAALIYSNARIFSDLLSLNSVSEVKKLFKVSPSPYWTIHYNFGLESKNSSRNLSNAFLDKLVINVVAPFLFFYGKYIGEEIYKERSITFLEETNTEKNRVVENFINLGVPCDSAFDSQALLSLKTNYCDQKKMSRL